MMRLVLAIILHLDLWFVPVFLVVSTGALVSKGAESGLSVTAVVVWPIIQVARLKLGQHAVISSSVWGLVGTIVLGVPIALAQMVLLRYQGSIAVCELAVGVIAFIFSFAEFSLTSLLVVQWTYWRTCTVGSFVRLSVLLVTGAVLLFSVIH